MILKIINGPNLNLTGKRLTDIYGNTSLEKFFDYLKKKYSSIKLSFFQSNNEGKIIDEIQKTENDNTTAIIINAGAYSHYSFAIRDAIESTNKETIEVHISNIFSREEFRKNSVLSEVCTGIISGFSLFSYELAIIFLINKYNKKNIK